MQKCWKPHFGHKTYQTRLDCPYMQIFWVDKDSNISFTSDENHPMSRGIKHNYGKTTKSTKIRRSRRNYKFSFWKCDVFTHTYTRTHISGFTYSLCRRVTMTMPKKILSTQPAQLTHRCNSAFNASHLKFIILSGTIAFLSVAEIIFTHHSAAANKIRNNLAKLRFSFEKWQYSTCKIEMLYI